MDNKEIVELLHKLVAAAAEEAASVKQLREAGQHAEATYAEGFVSGLLFAGIMVENAGDVNFEFEAEFAEHVEAEREVE